MTALPTRSLWPDHATCHRLEPVAPVLTVWDLADPDADVPDEPPVTSAVSVASTSPDDEVPPEVRRVAVSFARALVEGLNGRRTAAQFGDRVGRRVVSRILLRAAADCGLPAFTAASLRVQLVTSAYAEVTVRLERSGRSVPLAFRLDHRRGCWRCTALQVGPNPD